MNRVCITLLLCCLSSCRMNKTERMEMSEDSIDTVRIDQGVGKKTVSDSLKIGIADDGITEKKKTLAYFPKNSIYQYREFVEDIGHKYIVQEQHIRKMIGEDELWLPW